jgi:hypothetical protein
VERKEGDRDMSTFEELCGHTVEELKAIRNDKRKLLYKIRNEQHTLISNIISLENLIKLEIGKPK